MLIRDLITTVREDYTRDANSDNYLWSDQSLFRKFTEAERQACNRAKLIYDDSTTQYTRITLVSGQASYDIDHKITSIEKVIFDGDEIEKKTADELTTDSATWRTDTGMLDNTIYYLIRGRKIRFSRIPDADDDGETVTLEVYRLPDADIVHSMQEPEIPEEYHRDLIYWVLHECYSKKDVETFDANKALEYLAQFNMVFGPYVTARVRQHQFENPSSTLLQPFSYTQEQRVVTNFDYDA